MLAYRKRRKPIVRHRSNLCRCQQAFEGRSPAPPTPPKADTAPNGVSQEQSRSVRRERVLRSWVRGELESQEVTWRAKPLDMSQSGVPSKLQGNAGPYGTGRAIVPHVATCYIGRSGSLLESRRSKLSGARLGPGKGGKLRLARCSWPQYGVQESRSVNFWEMLSSIWQSSILMVTNPV